MTVQARDWIGTFGTAFPDVHMDIVELIAELPPAGGSAEANDSGDGTVVGRFTCSGTPTGPWRGHEPTGHRFEHIDEVGIYNLAGGRIIEAWTLEDTLTRLRHLGLPAGALTSAMPEIAVALAVAAAAMFGWAVYRGRRTPCTSVGDDASARCADGCSCSSTTAGKRYRHGTPTGHVPWRGRLWESGRLAGPRRRRPPARP